MVSNIPYVSFKRLKLSKVRTIEFFALVIVLIILVVIFPQNTIFIIFSVYAASGLLFYVPRMILKKRYGVKPEKAEEDAV
jgi:CDP-diacylglycerol--serine O-phosphatidyltransferase